jgi:hypothetical protein
LCGDIMLRGARADLVAADEAFSAPSTSLEGMNH